MDFLGGYAGVPANINQIKTKADAVKYAIEFTADIEVFEGLQKRVIPNYERAQKLIDFISANVTLPDTDAITPEKLVSWANEVIRVLKVQTESKTEAE